MVSLFDKAKALPKEEHSEIVRSGREYEKYESHIPSVGEMSGPTKPGEIVDKKFPWETMLAEQGIPTADFFRITTLLSMLIDQADKKQQVSTVSDFTKVENILVRAQVASVSRYEQTIQSISPYGYIYIPNNPTSPISSYRLYKGIGKSELIYAGSNQVPFSIGMPHIDNITIQFDSDVATDTVFQVYQSVRPFTLANPAGGSGLGYALPPYNSTEWYDSTLSYSGGSSNRAMVAGNLYTSFMSVPRPLHVLNAGISIVTAALTAGTHARLSLYQCTTRPVMASKTAGDVVGTLIRDMGQVLIDAIGVVTLPFDFWMMPGIVYMPTINVEADVTINGIGSQFIGMGRDDVAVNSTVNCFNKAFAYAPAPAQLIGPMGLLTAAPRIDFQAA